MASSAAGWNFSLFHDLIANPDFRINYLAPILKNVGITSAVTQAGISLALQVRNAFFAFGGALSAERFDRRPLWLLSACGMLQRVVRRARRRLRLRRKLLPRRRPRQRRGNRECTTCFGASLSKMLDVSGRTRSGSD